MPNIQSGIDSRLVHRDLGQSALTTTTTLATVQQRVAMRTKYMTTVILEALDISSGDELYNLAVQVSNDSFATLETAFILSLGHTSVRLGGAPTNTAGQVYQFEWGTEVAGVTYKDFRIRLIAAGTTPSMALACFSFIQPGF